MADEYQDTDPATVKIRTVCAELEAATGYAFRRVGQKYYEAAHQTFNRLRCANLREHLWSSEAPTGRTGTITERQYFMPRWMSCAILSLEYGCEAAFRGVMSQDRLWRRFNGDERLRRVIDTIAVATGFFDFVDDANFSPNGEGLAKYALEVIGPYLRPREDAWIDNTVEWTPWPFRESSNGKYPERRADLMRPYLCVEVPSLPPNREFVRLSATMPQTMDESLWRVPTWVDELTDALYFDRGDDRGLASTTITAVLRAVANYHRPAQAAAAVLTFHDTRKNGSLLKDYAVEIAALDRDDIDYGMRALRNAQGMVPPRSD